MQQARPTQSPSIQPFRLIGLHNVLTLTNLDDDQPIFPQLEANWPLNSHTYDELSELHEVADPPPFTGATEARMLLLQFSEDYFEQVFNDDVLIVISIVQQEPTRKQKIKATWAPRKLTRKSALDFLRVAWFCDQPETLCFLYKNNQVWAFEDSTVHHLAHGDHIRLQYRSTKYSWCDIEHSEAITRSRRVFISSDEDTEPRPTESTVGHRSARSEPRVRSRTRSPGRHNSPQAGSESYSLLQLSTGHSGLPQQELTDPHVSDRWCDLSATAGAKPYDHTAIDFGHVIKDFEWMDTHLFLPTFYFEAAWLPPSDRWLSLPWYTPDQSCLSLWIYFDGSFLKETHKAGAGVAAFAETEQGWHLCGLISTPLEEATDSYGAETYAALIAAKFAHDLLKLAASTGSQAPQVHLVYDNATVGMQSVGTWTCVQRPRHGHAVRHLVQMGEHRFNTEYSTHHVYGHQGDPGNEIVDTQQKDGLPTNSWISWLTWLTQVSWTTLPGSGSFFAWILANIGLNTVCTCRTSPPLRLPLISWTIWMMILAKKHQHSAWFSSNLQQPMSCLSRQAPNMQTQRLGDLQDKKLWSDNFMTKASISLPCKKHGSRSSGDWKMTATSSSKVQPPPRDTTGRPSSSAGRYPMEKSSNPVELLSRSTSRMKTSRLWQWTPGTWLCGCNLQLWSVWQLHAMHRIQDQLSKTVWITGRNSNSHILRDTQHGTKYCLGTLIVDWDLSSPRQ